MLRGRAARGMNGNDDTHLVAGRLANVLRMIWWKRVTIGRRVYMGCPKGEQGLTAVRRELALRVVEVHARVRERLACATPRGPVQTRLRTHGWRWGVYVPIPVTTAVAVSSSPTRPAGLTNEVPMSTETPVMYCPLVATASEPSVSVRDMISPPCTVCGPLSLNSTARRIEGSWNGRSRQHGSLMRRACGRGDVGRG